MSASLVGSEMCIRDSPNPVRRFENNAASKCKPPPRKLCPTPCASQAMRAVSYTHLTLPTICSV
eukprot:6534427-Alexandrium_andersonii.AAC.1